MRILALSFAFVLAFASSGCRRPAALREDPPPSVVVREDSEGLLLTWIDDKGDFHVEQKVKDVPLAGRDLVRVVDPMKDEGTHDKVILADLRTARPDGTYAVRVIPRREFDQMAVERRAKQGHATLASAAPPIPPPGAPPGATPPATSAPTPPAAARSVVIIYGAEWCGACHEAARWLKRKNIPFVEKNIEADPAAAAEMQAKLQKHGLHGGSIPVIDVRGTVMVGFDPGRVEAALGQAL